MKNIVVATIIMGILVGSVGSVLGQTTEQKDNITDLKAQLAALQTKLKAEESKADTPVSRFAGMGQEIGVALREVVTTIDGTLEVSTERIDQFSETKVGKFAMIVIGWRMLGKDFYDRGYTLVGDLWLNILGLIMLAITIHAFYNGMQLFLTGGMVVTKKEGPWYNRVKTIEKSVPLHKSDISSDAYVSWVLIYLAIVGMLVGCTIACFVN